MLIPKTSPILVTIYIALILLLASCTNNAKYEEMSAWLTKRSNDPEFLMRINKCAITTTNLLDFYKNVFNNYLIKEKDIKIVDSLYRTILPLGRTFSSVTTPESLYLQVIAPSLINDALKILEYDLKKRYDRIERHVFPMLSRNESCAIISDPSFKQRLLHILDNNNSSYERLQRLNHIADSIKQICASMELELKSPEAEIDMLKFKLKKKNVKYNRFCLDEEIEMVTVGSELSFGADMGNEGRYLLSGRKSCYDIESVAITAHTYATKVMNGYTEINMYYVNGSATGSTRTWSNACIEIPKSMANELKNEKRRMRTKIKSISSTISKKKQSLAAIQNREIKKRQEITAIEAQVNAATKASFLGLFKNSF